MNDLVSYELLAEEAGGIAIISIDNPPVNALGTAVRDSLLKAVRRFSEDPEAKVALLLGTGKTFTAGADIREFGKPPLVPSLTMLNNEIEDLEKPVICAIHGTALGGGLEIALSCHYRVALKTARLGLPEVKLGLLPGAGGTQRLPRLTGLKIASEIITSGRQVPAHEALDLEIVDFVADGTDPRMAGLHFARKILNDNRPVRRTKDLHKKIVVDKGNTQLFESLYRTATKQANGKLSPLSCIEATIAAVELPFEQGLMREQKLFTELLGTDQCKALIHVFFADREVSKIPELKTGTPRSIESAAIIGGGTMGSGIAASLLYAGIPVTMIERDETSAAQGRIYVERILDEGVERGKIELAECNRLAHILFSTATDISAIGSADIVIEAAFEDMSVKKALFVQIDEHAKLGAVLASNTSYLNINEIAGVTSRPQDVLGLHFFSPAHVMKLLEVVVGNKTLPDVTATGFALAKQLEKVAVRAGVCDGFIGNRILEHYLDLVSFLVEDGTNPYDIDKAVIAFGFPMGPNQMCDLAGLDIGLANRNRKRSEGLAGRYASEFVDRIANLGRFGQKTGRGFYIYENGSRIGAPDPEVLNIIAQVQVEKNIKAKSLDANAIMQRYLAAMINESARVVEEGIALRPLDVDITMINGYGFPRWRGGPLKYADSVGLEKILSDIRSFEIENPEFWKPAKLIVDLVIRGENFDSLNNPSTPGKK